MRTTHAWRSTGDGSTTLERTAIERRDLRDDDLAVRIDYCGVCHSDLHRIKGMLGEGAATSATASSWTWPTSTGPRPDLPGPPEPLGPLEGQGPSRLRTASLRKRVSRP